MRPVRHVAVSLVAAAVVVAAGSGVGAGAQPEPPAQSQRDKTIRYWTPERVANAKARDIVRDGGPGPSAQKGKPGGGGGGTATAVTGASWTKGGLVKETTGKVLFSLGASNYVCSGSVVNNAQTG